MTIRIANAAGFLGDSLDAPRRLLDASSVDVLTLEYLAELTVSILAHQRRKQPSLGYARDFLTVLDSIRDHLARPDRPRIVTNAGGVHPRACVEAAARRLVDQGVPELRIAGIWGDELTDRLDALRAAGCPLAHLDTGRPLAELDRPVTSAHAYLGARPIADALEGRADLVITGRVADASLTVGPAVHHFGWAWDDYDRLAAASVAGHLIECGAQVTGGYSVRWDDVELEAVGYPIAEVDARGDAIITKPEGSGGRVDRLSVIEQLVYEIGDPRAYRTPDVTVDFTSVDVRESDADRVAVRGARGTPPPADYKVSLAYHDGFTSSVQLVVAGRHCVEKARRTAELIIGRLARAGVTLDRVHIECLGAGESVPGLRPCVHGLQRLEDRQDRSPSEVVLRVSARDRRRDAIERFTKEAAPLITSGPAGLAGYAVGRSASRPVFAYWPTTVPRDLVEAHIEIRTARQWLESAADLPPTSERNDA
ncbi:MAG: DUF1446 domain-containing protein [Planctomycetes bacterium]|nr:DUF1446 domain-containing protein [Planctomycetota bacterium]